MAAWLGNSLRLLALAVLIVLGVAAASPAVVQLQADTIDEITAKSSDTWIIEFFAPWCGHCQKLLPKFEEAAKAARKAKLPVRFGKVDCEDEDSKSLCKDRFEINGFPSILYFPSPRDAAGQATGNGASKAASNARTITDLSPAAAKEYSGPRTAEALKDLAQRLSRSPIVQLPIEQQGSGDATSSGAVAGFDLHSWIAGNGRDGVAFLLVDSNDSIEDSKALRSAYENTALRLRDSLTFASIKSSDLYAATGVSKYLANAPAVPYVARVETAASSGRAAAAGSAGGVQYVTVSELTAPGRVPYTLKSGGGGGKRKSSAPASADATDAGKKAAAAGEALYRWTQHWRWPSVIQLGSDNFASAANNPEGRYLFISAIHGTDVASNTPPSSSVLNAIRRLADPATSSLRVDVRDRLLFGWLDADFKDFEGFLEQFSIKPSDCPRLLVLDAPNKVFWVDDTVDEEDEMDTWLTDIIDGRAPMQRQGIMAVPQKIYNHLGWAGAGALALVIVGAGCYLIYILVIAEAMGWNDAKRKEKHQSSGAGAAGSRAGAAKSSRTAPSVHAGRNASTNSNSDDVDQEDDDEDDDDATPSSKGSGSRGRMSANNTPRSTGAAAAANNAADEEEEEEDDAVDGNDDEDDDNNQDAAAGTPKSEQQQKQVRQRPRRAE